MFSSEEFNAKMSKYLKAEKPFVALQQDLLLAVQIARIGMLENFNPSSMDMEGVSQSEIEEWSRPEMQAHRQRMFDVEVASIKAKYQALKKQLMKTFRASATASLCLMNCSLKHTQEILRPEARKRILTFAFPEMPDSTLAKVDDSVSTVFKKRRLS